MSCAAALADASELRASEVFAAMQSMLDNRCV